MGNGLYRINWPGIHFDRRTEVHPTVLRDVTTAVSDSEAHAVEHAEVGEQSGHKRYNGAQPGARTGISEAEESEASNWSASCDSAYEIASSRRNACKETVMKISERISPPPRITSENSHKPKYALNSVVEANVLYRTT